MGLTTLLPVLLYSALVLLFFYHAQPHRAPAAPHATRAFNTTEANFSLHLCKAAYCDLESLANWSCGPSCDLYSDVEVFNVYVNESLVSVGYSAVSHREQRILFVFRGTYCVTNWLSDLTFWHMPYPHYRSCGENCTVHRGFYLTYESIMPYILVDAIVLRALYPSYRVLATGHSLGGALATLCAADLIHLHEGLPADVARTLSVQLLTFGSPRVGNSAFVGWLAGRLTTGQQFRVTHRNDPVPHLPPRSWDYVHLPQEVWYSSDLTPPEAEAGYRMCTDNVTDEDQSCSAGKWATSISDHLSYLDTCTQCRCDGPPPEATEVQDPAVLAALRDDLAYTRTRRNN